METSVGVGDGLASSSGGDGTADDKNDISNGKPINQETDLIKRDSSRKTG